VQRLSGASVAEAYRDACLAELRALKPGNVHLHAAGHDMTVADFEVSARVSAPAMGRPDLSVGERIYEAVRQTQAATGQNTNLGIVLLCAPLAQAALDDASIPLRARVRGVLDALDVADAELAFRAIRLARPGGLGTSRRHDVSAPATVTLRAAMAEARNRDRIAAARRPRSLEAGELGHHPCLYGLPCPLSGQPHRPQVRRGRRGVPAS